MELTKTDREFIKRNKEYLESLFSRRLIELKKNISVLDPNMTADEFKIKFLGYKNFINEIEMWLKQIKILSRKSETEIEDGI